MNESSLTRIEQKSLDFESEANIASIFFTSDISKEAHKHTSGCIC